MRLLNLTILLLASVTAFSQIEFEVRNADTSNTKFDSILIIGTGSLITKVFLENLSDHFIKEFSKKGGTANFYFAGSNIANFNINSDTINREHYKAILYLMPRNAGAAESMTSLNTNFIGTSAGTLTTYRPTNNIFYSQNFNFQLFKPSENMKKIWSASVIVNADISKSKSVKKLAKKILKNFKDNNYTN